MTPIEFAFWLDGFLAGNPEPGPREMNLIRMKLNSVFVKVTPSVNHDLNAVYRNFEYKGTALEGVLDPTGIMVTC